MKRKLKHRRKTPDYAIRAAALAKLGFRSYQDYLASPLWRKIRAKVLPRAGGRCAFCDAPATQVHHRAYTYRVLRGLKPNLLVQCCRPCHKDIEFWPDGRKRDPFEVRARSRQMQAAHERRRAAERASLAVPADARPTPEGIEAAKTKRGGWTREQLAKWGVPWPPPKGWRAGLERLEEQMHDAMAREA
jgi:hypothetical protein